MVQLLFCYSVSKNKKITAANSERNNFQEYCYIFRNFYRDTVYVVLYSY